MDSENSPVTKTDHGGRDRDEVTLPSSTEVVPADSSRTSLLTPPWKVRSLGTVEGLDAITESRLMWTGPW